jgi:hypothetical protein
LNRLCRLSSFLPLACRPPVPANLWAEKDLTVTLTVNQGTQNPKTAAKIAKTKLTFSESKHQGICGGFFREHAGTVSATNPENRYLMIPVVGFNNATATTNGSDALKQSLVSFAVADPALATVVPGIPTQNTQPITVKGSGIWQSDLVPLNGVLSFNNTKKTLATLNLQLMEQRTFSVFLHFVSNPTINNSTPSTMPKANKVAQFVQNLQQGLNNIWGPQANVQFNVVPPAPARGDSLRSESGRGSAKG